MMEYREGGLKDQGGSVDPVSGNEVPPGALKEEVRDDIDARLSEGEFVFPADVVRYIGLEKLMVMRQQAKAGLARMEDMGQMSNADEAVMEDTVSAAVFDMPDDMDVPAVMVAELEMAEGGDVQGEKRYKSFRELMGTDGDTAEIVTYVNKEGRKIIIMHINGAPVSQVPEGFYPEGTDAPAETTPETPTEAPAAAPQQPQVQQEDPSAPDPERQGATVVTGGYVQDGRILGGIKWDMSYEFDGSVNLSNPEYGEVQLTKEEAVAAGIGQGSRSILGAFMPEELAASKQRAATLNSGSATDPGAGNEIHKALVERAELQKAGREFVEGRSPELGFTDSIKSVFGSGPRNELEGAIAAALGKTSNEFTDADYALVGLALKGGAQVHDLGTGGPDYTKVNAVQTLLKDIDNNLIRSGLDRPDMIGQGTSAPDPTLGLSGNRYVISDNEDQNPPGGGELPSGPGGDEALPTDPQYGLRRPDMLGMGTSRTVNDPRPSNMYNYNPPVQTRPTPLVEPSPPTPKPTSGQRFADDTVSPSYANLSGMSLSRAPGADMGGLYEFDPRPVNDPRPSNQYSFPSSSSSSLMSTPTNFERTSTPFYAGGDAKKRKKKKRKGLASR